MLYLGLHTSHLITDAGLSWVMAGYGWNISTNPAPANASWINQSSVVWPSGATEAAEWLQAIGGATALLESFMRDGFVITRNLLPTSALGIYQSLYSTILNDLETPGRHDLGAHKP